MDDPNLPLNQADLRPHAGAAEEERDATLETTSAAGRVLSSGGAISPDLTEVRNIPLSSAASVASALAGAPATPVLPSSVDSTGAGAAERAETERDPLPSTSPIRMFSAARETEPTTHPDVVWQHPITVEATEGGREGSPEFGNGMVRFRVPSGSQIRVHRSTRMVNGSAQSPPNSNNNSRRRRTVASDAASRIRAQTLHRPTLQTPSPFNVVRGGGRGRGRVHASPPSFVQVHSPNTLPPIPSVTPPPLHALVLPDQKQNLVDEDPALDKFKCAICYDVMVLPHGHTGCSLRVCENCAYRMLEQAKAKVPPQQLVCPTCRLPIAEYEVDNTLRDMIGAAPAVRCRYADCTSGNIPLTEINEHEADCGAIKVACRYGRFGCAWVGPRMHLAAHEDNDCDLAKVSGLVSQFSTLLTNFQHTVTHLQARDVGIYQMQQMLQQQTQTLAQSTRQHLQQQESAVREAVNATASMASPNNPFLVAEYLVALFTRTLQVPARWKLMETTEARASIFNQLMLLPILLLSIGFCSRETAKINAAGKGQVDFVEIGAGCLSVFLSVMILVALFWIDNGSSVGWRAFPLENVCGLNLGSRRIAFSAVSIVATLLFGLFFMDANERAGYGYACFYYAFATSALLCCPITFLALAHELHDTTGENGGLSDESWKTTVYFGRAAEPLLAGLWLGFAWGSTNAVDPILLLLLAILYSVLVHSKIPRRIALPIIGVASGIFASLVDHTRDALDPTALLLFVLSTAVALIFQRSLAVGFYFFAKASFRPRSDLLMLAICFIWVMLLAV